MCQNIFHFQAVPKSIFRTVLSWFSYFLQSGKLQETFIKIWGSEATITITIAPISANETPFFEMFVILLSSFFNAKNGKIRLCVPFMEQKIKWLNMVFNHYFGTKIKLGRYELDWQTKLQSSVTMKFLQKLNFRISSSFFDMLANILPTQHFLSTVSQFWGGQAWDAR